MITCIGAGIGGEDGTVLLDLGGAACYRQSLVFWFRSGVAPGLLQMGYLPNSNSSQYKPIWHKSHCCGLKPSTRLSYAGCLLSGLALLAFFAAVSRPHIVRSRTGKKRRAKGKKRGK
jgi:hypothetical protein